MQENTAKTKTQSLVVRLADKYGVEPAKLLKCLTTQVFRQRDGAVPTNEELMVLLLVCENYGLNPFAREIYGFRGKSGDIVPVVSLDGWTKVVRSQKDFNGMAFSFSEKTVTVAGYAGELPEYVECSMRLKGIETPIVIQEYMQECFNERSAVWKQWPRRMLRTRAFIQCARLAFSLTGLYDEGDVYGDDGLDGKLTLPGVPTAPAPLAASEPAKLTLDREQLTQMVTKLTTLACGRDNGFTRAREWVSANLSGDDRRYAEEVLAAKENETRGKSSAEAAHPEEETPSCS